MSLNYPEKLFFNACAQVQTPATSKNKTRGFICLTDKVSDTSGKKIKTFVQHSEFQCFRLHDGGAIILSVQGW